MAEHRGMPSMLALLGLLAVAGYQNRDKLGQLLQGAGAGKTGEEATEQGGGLLGQLGNMIGGATTGGGSIKQGLDDLLGTFKNGGANDEADSWVTPGVPTRGLSPAQVESAIGRDKLQDLATQTGINYDELVKRLSVSIPEAVDKMTPDGRFPQDDREAVDRLIKA